MRRYDLVATVTLTFKMCFQSADHAVFNLKSKNVQELATHGILHGGFGGEQSRQFWHMYNDD